MKVELCFYASFASRLPENREGNSCTTEIDEGSTVRELLDKMGLPEDLPKIVFLNGLHAKYDDVLKPGDRLAVFPPIAGG
jgi:molybdopterin synthase sulfur carrier subunit